MGLFDTLFQRKPASALSSSPTPQTVKYKGLDYPLSGYNGLTGPGGTPRIGASGDFMSLVEVGQPHAIISSAIQVRAGLVSQVRPTFRDLKQHNLFDGAGTRIFTNTPAFASLLMRAEQHIAYSGNAYFYRDRVRNRITLLRPDYLQLVIRSESNEESLPDYEAIDAELLGYIYRRPGSSRYDVLSADDVAHWIAEPHPATQWVGASWVASAVRDVLADIQADGHADAYFVNAAVPRLVYKMDPSLDPAQAEEFKAINEARHKGAENAYRSLYVGGATDVQVVGTTMKDLALRDYRGALESRMAVRSRVPATILGISEGLEGSTLNSGNYDATRRLFADVWFTPHADVLAAALDTIVDKPRGAYLSWDPRRVLFLQDDRKDDADIHKSKAAAVAQYINAGYEPASVVAAVDSGDLTKLVHTGLLSVQLQPAPTDPTLQSPDSKNKKKDGAGADDDEEITDDDNEDEDTDTDG